ncbi:hypothetical protein H6G80_14165 [Nostoc sp. FACHB-87]|uniref:hypothetical protein n=1 Tax=Nostocaceae TaxID=1162 RepID=UPI00168983CA|nr:MULTISPECIES: hypothetical protein [Nostocaceae]MBD2455223.1 hypothetical protein [Nostoc sp. FACHB-87]MBD2476952.1 hypothetical protein [Anabaena sp. FACHB-83]
MPQHSIREDIPNKNSFILRLAGKKVTHLENVILDETIVEIVDQDGVVKEVTLRIALAIFRKQEIFKDKALGIKRNHIPFKFFLLPDEPQNPDFCRLSHTINNIAVFDFEPYNSNQAIWMRCVQLYWQAKAILLPNKIFNLITDTTQLFSLVQQLIPPQAFENLKLETDAETSLYKLLAIGESDIISWANTQGIDYPFKNFEELFIHILKSRFQMDVQEQAFALKPLWKNQKDAKRHHRGWLKFLNNHDLGAKTEAEYNKILMDMEWEGYPLIVLKSPSIHKPFKNIWQSYLKTQRALVKLIDTDLYWKDNIPYQTKHTNRRLPIQGIVTNEGKFEWVWELQSR